MSRIRLLVVALSVVGLSSSMFAQTLESLVQQWTEKRIDVERILFLRRSWQISDAEYRDRSAKVNLETRDILLQIGKLPRDQQVQARVQSDSLLTVRVVPLRQQWQQETTEREKQIRSGIASDAEKAGKLQAERTLLNEKLQRHETSQADFSREDQRKEQEVLALQSKWDAVDPNWGRFFSQSWQRLVPVALVDLRKRETVADEQDVRTAAGLELRMQHDVFLGEKQVITPQEQERRIAGPMALLAPIQARYGKGVVERDFTSRVAKLVEAGVREQRPQWEAEVRSALGSNAPPAGPAPPPGNSKDNSKGNSKEVPTTQPPTAPRPPVPPPPAPDARTSAGKAYLKEMPTPARILGDIQGANPADTVERQLGAFTWLQDFIYGMADQRNQTTTKNSNRLTAEEQRLFTEYAEARQRLMAQPHKSDGYSFDRRYRNEVLKRFFPPSSPVYRTAYEPADDQPVPASPPQGQAPASRWTSGMVVIPLIFLLAGAAAYFVYRRGAAIPPASYDVKGR